MSSRFEAFDGLRGFAALVVVLGHFFDDGPFKNFIGLNLLTDTKVAVAIFFILSGFVLCQTKRPAQSQSNLAIQLIRKSLARFVRLAVPVLGVTLIAFLIQPYIQPATDPSVYWNVFTEFYDFQRSAFDLLYYSFVDVFFLADFTRNYIPPSWTMRPELFCSVFIFLFPWWNLKQDSWRVVSALASVAFLLIATYGYLPFVYYLGFFVAGAALRFMPNNPPPLVAVLAALVAKTALNFIGLRYFAFDFVFSLVIVITVFQSGSWRRVFASKPLLFLGKISFPLYLIHVPLIALLAPRLSYIAATFELGSSSTLIFVFFTFMPCVIFVSWLLISLDKAAILLSRKIKS